MKTSIKVVAALAMMAFAPWGAFAQETKTTNVVIFAAASLKNALDEAAARQQKETGASAALSYAASSALAKQIEQGAPADIFVSADLDWMDYLEKANLIAADTRANLLGNRLVLIAPASKPASLKIAPNFALAEALGEGRLAVADVKAVPAGKYAKAALEKLGAWEAVEGKLAQAENVRAALALVSRGEVPLGIVYQTDAAADAGVKVVDVFPEDSHPPIVYPIAVTAASKSPDAARGFVAFLKGPGAAEIFSKHGFTVLK